MDCIMYVVKNLKGSARARGASSVAHFIVIDEHLQWNGGCYFPYEVYQGG